MKSVQQPGTWRGHDIHALGDDALLGTDPLAVFCSTRCPGKLILEAQDLARSWRDAGTTVISGFHTPVEQEILRILLRGAQPLIICPARGLPKRVPQDHRAAMAAGRLLYLTPFGPDVRRPTRSACRLRNELVADHADAIVIVHAPPGSQTSALAQTLTEAGRPVRCFERRIRLDSVTCLPRGHRNFSLSTPRSSGAL